MTDSSDRRGEAPDAGELLVAALGIAGLTKTLQERAATQQDETLRVLQRLEGADQRLQAMGQELQRRATPAEVQRVGERGQAVIADFERKVAALTKTLSAELAVLSDQSWRRTKLTMLTLVCCVGLAVWSIRWPGPLKGVTVIENQSGVWVPVQAVEKKCNDQGQACIYVGLVRDRRPKS